jgi:hypothetical protein
MKHSVMVTTLFNGEPADKLKYYFSKENERTMYCDALLPAEASSKYILANHHIDEIVVLGSRSTYDPGDELVPMVLRDGKSFYASDISSLSNYSLLRYRLAEFLDELRIEEQDIRDLLTEEEQAEAIAVIKSFFNEKVRARGNVRFNRLFDAFVQAEELRDELKEYFTAAVPAAVEDETKYSRWIRYYLYSELKETSKYEILEGNRDVTVRFVPADADSESSFAGRIADGLKLVGSGEAGIDEVEMFVCIQSEDADDTRTLMNMIDIIRSMPDSVVKISKILTTSKTSDIFANLIKDETEVYGISELIAGIRAFLRYGKTDMLIDYWNSSGIDNPKVSRLIYAMRNIDIGISLCDISDIERGIGSLRRLIRDEEWEKGTSIIARFFDIIVEGIKQDYGNLIAGDEIEFIDLVKWAYRKGFWQQTLTLIESRAPMDLVKRGIFYYADSEESKEDALKKFGQIYFDLRPHEKYKLRDVDHFFIKTYGRYRVPRTDNNDSHQKQYTNLRISDLDTEDEEIIRAYTSCPDREALRSLLYAYYHLGDVRNSTNHASDDVMEFYDIMQDSDVSARMEMINQAIDFFIYHFDHVANLVSDAEPEVHRLNTAEIASYAKTLIPPKTTRAKSSKTTG